MQREQNCGEAEIWNKQRLGENRGVWGGGIWKSKFVGELVCEGKESARGIEIVEVTGNKHGGERCMIAEVSMCKSGIEKCGRAESVGVQKEKKVRKRRCVRDQKWGRKMWGQ